MANEGWNIPSHRKRPGWLFEFLYIFEYSVGNVDGELSALLSAGTYHNGHTVVSLDGLNPRPLK